MYVYLCVHVCVFVVVVAIFASLASSSKEHLYLFHGKENVKGKVVVRPKNSRIEYKSIKISLIGEIGLYSYACYPF
jgi:Vacuolar protein sorting-associated protein 26